MTQSTKIMAVSDIHQKINSVKMALPFFSEADLVIILGDITQFGNREDALGILNKIEDANPNILAVAGNLDHPDVNDLLEEKGINLHCNNFKMGEIGFAGIGASNPTPFRTPFEISEKEILEKFSKTAEAISDAKIKIYISHSPPYKTKVDRTRFGLHAGSKAIRRVVEEHKPDLLLCGHIHEARGTDNIGHTKIINPGPLSSGGYIWIEIGNNILHADIRMLT